MTIRLRPPAHGLCRDGNVATGGVGIWYLGWMGGNFYEASPGIPETLGKNWQLPGYR